MRFRTSSFVLASLAISGTTLAAPTPPMPFDSPVPNSPNPDEWTESIRSPHVARSPFLGGVAPSPRMLPAVRIAGRRRSPPRSKRQDADADASTANAQGLLGGLGDALDGLLHNVEGVVNGIPLIGGLGILSTPDAASPPPADGSQPQKRQAPDGDGDASTPNAQGLLGGLGDALDGLLHNVEGVVNGIPLIGGLGILSTPDAASPPPADGSQPQKRQAPEAQIPGFTTPSPLTPPTSAPNSSTPPVSSLSSDQLASLRQTVSAMLQQQQQAEQIAAVLSAAAGGLPVHPYALHQRLQALLAAQSLPGQGAPVSSGPPNPLNVQGLVGNAPIAGQLLSQLTGGNGLGGLAPGLLSNVQGLTGGLPVVGGLLSSNGLLGGVLGGVAGSADDLLGGAAGGLLGGILGGQGNNGILSNILGGQDNSEAQSQSINSPFSVPSPWPDANGFYPHSYPGGAPLVPQNSPYEDAMNFPFGSFAVDDTSNDLSPPAPPPSPAVSAASVPMDHDPSMSSSPMASTSPTEPAATTTASTSTPGETQASSTLSRRRADEESGEDNSAANNEDADGFIPTMPPSTYTPPLMVQSARSDVHGVPAYAMHEGGIDAVPGPQDRINGVLTAPRLRKMVRRHIRGHSVAF